MKSHTETLIRKGIDVSLIFNKDFEAQFSKAQWKQVMKGYRAGINFGAYAHPSVPSIEMLAHRLRLQGVA